MESDQKNGINGKALNGYRVRSWGDLLAVSLVISLFLSVVAWGLKLESELNELRNGYGIRIANLEARVADGILPRAEERIDSLRRDLNYLDDEFNEHEQNEHK